MRQLRLGQSEVAPALRDAIGDLCEEPAVLGVGQPLADPLEGFVCLVRGLTHISTTLYIAVMRYKSSIAAGATLRLPVFAVAGALLLVTGYELAVALGVVDLGSLPGEGAPGEGVVAVVAVLALLAATFLAVTLVGAEWAPRPAALLAPLAAAFLVARFYTFDPYYLPTLRRMSEGGLIPAAVIFVLAGAGIVAGLVTLVRCRAGLALSAPVILASGLAAWLAPGGH